MMTDLGRYKTVSIQATDGTPALSVNNCHVFLHIPRHVDDFGSYELVHSDGVYYLDVIRTKTISLIERLEN